MGMLRPQKKQRLKHDTKQNPKIAEKPKAKRAAMPSGVQKSYLDSFSVSNSNKFFSPLIIEIAKEASYQF